MKSRWFLRLSLFALVAAIFVYAQVPVVDVKVPFQFKVGEKVFPAGEYRISESDADSLKLESVADRSVGALLPVLTRLGAQTPGNTSVVFDRIGEDYTLSEVWRAGMDGYMVHTTPMKHEHAIVKALR